MAPSEPGAGPGQGAWARLVQGGRALKRRLAPRRGPVVISLPKSGRTQLRVMLDAMGLAPAFSHGGASDERGLTAVELAGVPDYWRACRVLFLMRDPRDTATSAYFHARFRSGVYAGGSAQFLRDPRYGLEKIIRLHLLWLEEGAGFKAFQVLQYEAVQQDPVAELRRATAFLFGVEPADADLARAVEAGRFETMRRMETSGEGAERFGLRLAPGDPERPESFKTRRGVVGDWRHLFSPEDAAYAEELLRGHRYQERLARTGVVWRP